MDDILSFLVPETKNYSLNLVNASYIFLLYMCLEFEDSLSYPRELLTSNFGKKHLILQRWIVSSSTPHTHM